MIFSLYKSTSVLLRSSLARQGVFLHASAIKCSGDPTALPYRIKVHGNREVIGFGMNGEEVYFDRPDYPVSAVRFREETPHIKELRKKELGDWHNLSTSEVMDLYRHTFCSTFAEMHAPSGSWKIPIIIVLWFLTFHVWLCAAIQIYGK